MMMTARNACDGSGSFHICQADAPHAIIIDAFSNTGISFMFIGELWYACHNSPMTTIVYDQRDPEIMKLHIGDSGWYMHVKVVNVHMAHLTFHTDDGDQLATVPEGVTLFDTEIGEFEPPMSGASFVISCLRPYTLYLYQKERMKFVPRRIQEIVFVTDE